MFRAFVGREESKGNLRKGLRMLLIGAVIALGYGGPAAAQSTWSGGGGSPYNWSNPSNWNTGPSSSTTTMTFSGSTGLTNNNDMSNPPTGLATLTFSTGAGSFNLQGGTLQFASTGSIVQNSANAQTIALPLVTTGTVTTSGTAAGALNITNTISGAGGITFSGTGTGGVVLNMSTQASYSGATIIGGSVVTLGSSNQLPSGTNLTIGTLAADLTSQLNLGSNNQTINNLTIQARGGGAVSIVVGSGTLMVTGSISLVDSPNGSLGNGNEYPAVMAPGTLDLGGQVCTITIAGQNNGVTPGDLTLSTIVTDGGINFTGNISDTLSVPTGMELAGSGPNTYSLGTTVNAGTLNVLASTTLGTGGLTMNQSGTVVSAVILNGSMTISSLSTGTISSSSLTTLTINNTGSVLTVNQASTTTFGGIIQGVGGLTMSGGGTLNLSGVNTYTGPTTINGGTLAVGYGGTGSLAVGSAVTVNASGTLAGTGTVNGPVTVNAGGTLSGGNSGVGTLTLSGQVTLVAGSTIGVAIADGSTPSTTPGGSTISPASNNSISITSGNVSINPGILISVNGTGTTFSSNSSYSYLIGNIAGVNLSTLDITNQAQFSTIGFSANAFSLTGDASGDVYLNFTVVPAPEPSTILLIGAAGAGFIGTIRRRRGLQSKKA